MLEIVLTSSESDQYSSAPKDISKFPLVYMTGYFCRSVYILSPYPSIVQIIYFSCEVILVAGRLALGTKSTLVSSVILLFLNTRGLVSGETFIR